MTTFTNSIQPLAVPPAGLGEGPTWDDATNTLLWVDIPRGLLHRTVPETGATTTTEVGPYPSFVYPAGPGWLLMAHRWDLELVQETTGEREIIFSLAGDEDTRLNDAKIDDSGRVVIGAMVYPWKQGGPCNVYRVDLAAGTSEVLASGMALSNGFDWNEDRSRLYFVDTPTRRIDVFEVAEDGTWGARATFVSIEEGAGNPDGLTLDAQGNIWIALFGGSAVRQYSPEGEIMGQVDIPVPHVTSLCFGGPSLEDIFVTTASSWLNDETRKLYPDAGKIFWIRGAATGHPLPPVALPNTSSGVAS